MDQDADIDGDGFYEYRTLAGEKGLKNQGWKDSSQAILYPDGRSCAIRSRSRSSRTRVAPLATGSGRKDPA